jgi:hypothetical protein
MSVIQTNCSFTGGAGSPDYIRMSPSGLKSGEAPLFPPQQPDSPITFEPSARAKGGTAVRCNYTGRLFGGVLYGDEVDIVVAWFRDWPGRVSPADLGAAAEQAIAATRLGGAE